MAGSCICAVAIFSYRYIHMDWRDSAAVKGHLGSLQRTHVPLLASTRWFTNVAPVLGDLLPLLAFTGTALTWYTTMHADKYSCQQQIKRKVFLKYFRAGEIAGVVLESAHALAEDPSSQPLCKWFTCNTSSTGSNALGLLRFVPVLTCRHIPTQRHIHVF